jgi:hypothetical protein
LELADVAEISSPSVPSLGKALLNPINTVEELASNAVTTIRLQKLTLCKTQTPKFAGILTDLTGKATFSGEIQWSTTIVSVASVAETTLAVNPSAVIAHTPFDISFGVIVDKSHAAPAPPTIVVAV